MIIFIVDYFGIAALKSECHAQVGLYCDSPDIFFLSFQLMQSQTVSVHVFDYNSRNKQGKKKRTGPSVPDGLRSLLHLISFPDLPNATRVGRTLG